MKRKLFYYSFIMSLMIGSVLAFNSVGKKDYNVRAEQPVGAPQLKLTWDFSPNTSTSTTAFTNAQLKTFIENHDAPNYTYTITSTANNYPGTGTSDSIAEDNWKFSSGSKNGSATISGLPEYGYVKVWAYQWGSDATKLTINDGTATTITGNAYNLYEFDVTDTTTFKINAEKRALIQKIEFWGC